MGIQIPLYLEALPVYWLSSRFPGLPFPAWFRLLTEAFCNGLMEPDSWHTVTGSPKNLTSFPLVQDTAVKTAPHPHLTGIKLPFLIYHNQVDNAICFKKGVNLLKKASNNFPLFHGISRFYVSKRFILMANSLTVPIIAAAPLFSHWKISIWTGNGRTDSLLVFATSRRTGHCKCSKETTETYWRDM